MVIENTSPTESDRPEEPPKIVTEPLPQILDELEANIRVSIEAAKKAEKAAEIANLAAGAATRSSEEARKVGEDAAARATQAANEAIKQAEESSLAAREAAARAEAAAKKAETMAEEALSKTEKLVAAMVRKALSSWQSILLIILIILGSVFAAVSISLGLSIMGN